MAGDPARRAVVRVDHATLLAAAGVGENARRTQREACREVLAQV
jgi:hypothetical protein